MEDKITCFARTLTDRTAIYLRAGGSGGAFKPPLSYALASTVWLLRGTCERRLVCAVEIKCDGGRRVMNSRGISVLGSGGDQIKKKWIK
jgi:hypothetical protein